MRIFWLGMLLLFGFIFVTLTGCSVPPPPATPSPSPSPSPSTTTSPQIISATATPARTLQSGDAIKPSTTVTFTGQGPANAVIRLYRGTSIIDTATADAAGFFTFSWTAGTTEESIELRFTAKEPDLPESGAVSFTLVIDGTGPYIVSGSAKADVPGGEPPVITLVFSEPLVINDMTFFTLVPSPFFGVVPTSGTFNLSRISLENDQKTVILRGTALTDQLPSGATIMVAFVPAPPLTVTDEAGNSCVSQALITFNVSP
ncbi:MAG: hypothetical protein ACUVRN_10350 [Candidatus Caldatribacteriaceae bacterium]